MKPLLGEHSESHLSCAKVGHPKTTVGFTETAIEN